MRKLMTAVWMMMAMLLMPVAAMAAEVATAAPVDSLPGWVGIIGAVLYGLAHATTRLPVTVTKGWPGWLRTLLNVIAANYGNAKNRDE